MSIECTLFMRSNAPSAVAALSSAEKGGKKAASKYLKWNQE
jgi:hypothetical protein